MGSRRFRTKGSGLETRSVPRFLGHEVLWVDVSGTHLFLCEVCQVDSEAYGRKGCRISRPRSK